jgi:2-C-methyl-D-erythritol 2,4-cyclodiphosphate synthase
MANTITRIGLGYDVHAFAAAEAERRLMIGGIVIPHDRGLAGHSDADVLLHALVDALLGAAALGDIGTHFPSTDPLWKDASSTVFLKHSLDLLKQNGWEISNVDATVVAERPRLAPHVPAIREHLAGVMDISPEVVSVKAKTTDGLGFVGRQEGIACFAVALLVGTGVPKRG